MTRKIGLTMGKFLPFHQGHELLLQTAKQMCNELIVLIGCHEDDPYTFAQKAKWAENAVQDKDGLIVLKQVEHDRNVPKDEKGTVTDNAYWDIWLKDTDKLIQPYRRQDITHVFTSDLYGERVAKEFGATWYPIDPERTIVDVSGTKVRSDIWQGYSKLPPYVRKDHCKVVALVGPESVGKSSLVPKLAEHYGCLFVPEYGRTVCHYRGRKIDDRDFEAIIDGQQAFISNAIHRSEHVPLVISDTEALVTAIYYNLYYPEGWNDHVQTFWKQQKIDLYLVLAPNVPWVQDGERSMTEVERWRFHYALVEELRKAKKNYHVVEASQYYMRSAQAINIINDFLSTSKTQIATSVPGDHQKRPREIENSFSVCG